MFIYNTKQENTSKSNFVNFFQKKRRSGANLLFYFKVLTKIHPCKSDMERPINFLCFGFL